MVCLDLMAVPDHNSPAHEESDPGKDDEDEATISFRNLGNDIDYCHAGDACR